MFKYFQIDNYIGFCCSVLWILLYMPGHLGPRDDWQEDKTIPAVKIINNAKISFFIIVFFLNLSLSLSL